MAQAPDSILGVAIPTGACAINLFTTVIDITLLKPRHYLYKIWLINNTFLDINSNITTAKDRRCQAQSLVFPDPRSLC
jgi:hypothetical protein